MTNPTPYISFPGTAAAALTFYADVFGGRAQLHTFGEFGRTDGPANAIAHGYLVDAPVHLFGSDIAGDAPAFSSKGLLFALLGTADAETLHKWFARLAEGGRIVDDLQQRPWGAHDGKVIDQFGLEWLIGYETN